MRYFRNSELVNLYGVSDKAVRNWIEAARHHKNKLELFEDNNKLFIADTINNSVTIQELVEQGRKYRNRRSHRTVRPLPKFYDLYDPRQIAHIINSLEKNGEFPFQYRYFEQGAQYWDAYLQKLYSAPRENMLSSTIRLLSRDWPNLKSQIKDYKYVNIIDVGVGNGLAVKELLLRVEEMGKLKSYIGVDISRDLLDIAERNVKQWIREEIVIKKYVKDLSFERFGETTVDIPSSISETHETINIFLFLGGTIGNFRDPSIALRTINESMGKDDILVTTDKLDSENSRRFFDFNTRDDRTALPLYNRFILEMLSIDDTQYNIEQYFDESEGARRIQIRLKFDLSIRFNIRGHERNIEFEKGDSILMVRMWEWSAHQLHGLFERSSFTQLRTLQSENEEYMLLVSKAKSSVKYSNTAT